MASRLLAPLIEAFQAKYPDLRVDLIMTDRRLDLANGEAEVAVRMHEPGDASLIARKIAASWWALYASRSYIERYGRPQRWEDLDDHSVIIFGGDMADNRASLWLRNAAPRARIAARSNSMLGALAAVKSGAGLAPLPMLLGGSEDGLVPVLAPIPELSSNIYLVMHSDLRSTARVRAFCDFMATEIVRFRSLLMQQSEKADFGSTPKP